MPNANAGERERRDALLMQAQAQFDVVAADEARQRQADLADDRQGEAAAPPAVVVDRIRLAQSRQASRISQVKVVGLRLEGPVAFRYHRACLVQPRGLHGIQHLAAHRHVRLRQPEERRHAQDAIRFKLDVVIQEGGMGDLRVLQAGHQAAAEPARAAEITLFQDPEFRTEAVCDAVEVRPVRAETAGPG